MKIATKGAITSIKELMRSVKRALQLTIRLMAFLLVLVAVMMLGVAGLSGCAPSVRLVSAEIPLSDQLRGCEVAQLPKAREMMTEDDIIAALQDAQVHSLLQTGNVLDCRGKNEVLIGLIEKHNERVREKQPWYRRLFQ